MARRMRAVGPDERPVGVGAAGPSVLEAAQSGDQVALLAAMRDRIAQAVSSAECPPRDLAALTKRLADITRELRALTEAAEDEERVQEDVSDAFDPEAI